MTEGILLVNKPSGMTSHDVVDQARKYFKMKRIGHAGTLDPLATGLLILLLGRSTKLFNEFVSFDKAYRATVILGTKTTSADIEGEIIDQKTYDGITREKVEEVLERFRGDIQQVPPMVSAVKHKGKRLYELARKGVIVKREPRDVTIRTLDIEGFDLPRVKLFVECSKGTYIRQLAEDIGQHLGCGACIEQIERTKIGDFSLRDSVKIEEFDERHIRHWQCNQTIHK